MTPAAKRLLYSVFIGIVLIPLAGFVGMMMSPSRFVGWLKLLAVSIVAVFNGSPLLDGKFVLAMLLSPIVSGAYFASPVTCIILPLAAAFWRPTTAQAPRVFLCLGMIAGGLTTCAMSWLKIGSSNQIHFYLAGVTASAACGYIFGRAMWRYDRRRATDAQETAAM